ncbi:MAG: 3-isopropylmalate dehydratase small subunit, partial [Acidimicrobiia bacterium]|nr:3-isopropylmalate dehydratase small subunit [Acidimicrobiia bacterium]
LATSADNRVTIDLATQTVTCGDLVARFEIDAYVKESLLAGLDHIGATLRHADDITGFERTRPGFKPTLGQTPTT